MLRCFWSATWNLGEFLDIWNIGLNVNLTDQGFQMWNPGSCSVLGLGAKLCKICWSVVESHLLMFVSGLLVWCSRTLLIQGVFGQIKDLKIIFLASLRGPCVRRCISKRYIHALCTHVPAMETHSMSLTCYNHLYPGTSERFQVWLRAVYMWKAKYNPDKGNVWIDMNDFQTHWKVTLRLHQ